MTGVNGSFAAKPAHRSRHLARRHERAADERQQLNDEDEAEQALGRLGRQTERDGQPGEREHEQGGDVGRRQPPACVGDGP